MTRLYRALTPVAQDALKLLAGVAVFVLITAAGVQYATVAHERYLLKQRVCAAQLEALIARNAFVEKFARNVDACLAMEIAAR